MLEIRGSRLVVRDGVGYRNATAAELAAYNARPGIRRAAAAVLPANPPAPTRASAAHVEGSKPAGDYLISGGSSSGVLSIEPPAQDLSAGERRRGNSDYVTMTTNGVRLT